MNKLGDSSGNSSIFSDNEIDNIALADVVINDNSDKEEKTCKTFLWEPMHHYSEHKELFSVNSGPRNEAENLSNAL